MFRRTCCAAALLAAVAVTPQRSWAWGDDGHVIVAKIAELNLKPEVRKEIQKLLGPIPISHPRIATFADFVRHNADYPQFAKTGPWHYVNIPLDAEGYDPARDCKDGQCVVAKIEDFTKVLADRDRKSDERLEALLFIVHFVGDVHQPLHCADRGDAGGNSLRVKFLGHGGNHLSLHSAWDTNLVHSVMKRMDAADYAALLANKSSAEERAALSKGTPTDWANESLRQAQKFAYKRPNGEELPRTGTPNLDKEYVNAAMPVVEMQLLKGGLRLAQVLNEALAPPQR